MEGELRHRMVETNGIQMHIAEQGIGPGPTVLLLHGFPDLWFSWRNQITHLARHGYHVVAPDMRGYGDTNSPADPAMYTLLHLVGDIVGLLDVLGQQQAFVVGHDWGAEVAWHLSLFRPDRVIALVNLGVPYRPRFSATRPVEMLMRIFGEGFYISQFQEVGRAEKSFARYDHLTVIKKFMLAKTPDLIAPPSMEIIDFLENLFLLPPWITEEELHYYGNKFQKSGFTGALNYYRAMDRNWEFLAPWEGAKIKVPSKLVVGEQDFGFQSFGIRDYINGDLKTFVPNIEVVVMDGHHFIQQEKPKEVTQEILSFFSKFSNV